MAKEKKVKRGVETLTPNSYIIVVDGNELRVPADKFENAMKNMVLAEQGRNLIQRSIRMWNDQDKYPTPKELADIASAMKNIASFSKEVYADPAIDERPIEKPAEKISDSDIDFTELREMPKVVTEEPAPGDKPEEGPAA